MREKFHYFNEDFFLKWSEEFAYFLGMFAGDGLVHQRKDNGKKQLILISTDKDVIEGYKRVIGFSGDIIEDKFDLKNPRWKRQYRITLNSDKICDRLMSLGLPMRKGKSKDWSLNVPKKYMGRFLRGYIDSDGCVNRSKKYYGYLRIVLYCSSKKNLENIKSFVSSNVHIVRGQVCEGKTTNMLYFNGRPAVALYKYAYSGSFDWEMKRKRRKGNEIIREYEEENNCELIGGNFGE